MLSIKKTLTKLMALEQINLTSSYSVTPIVIKRGGVATLRVNLMDLPKGSTTIAALPAGWRPPIDYVENIGHANGSTHMRLYVRSNGNIEVYNYGSAISGSANVQHSITYLIG